ncbi:MAG: hypothetical protein GX329_01220 [Tissierellia bacterium]|nr:hypothetical protein [Tissierellia bacterium]
MPQPIAPMPDINLNANSIEKELDREKATNPGIIMDNANKVIFFLLNRLAR